MRPVASTRNMPDDSVSRLLASAAASTILRSITLPMNRTADVRHHQLQSLPHLRVEQSLAGVPDRTDERAGDRGFFQAGEKDVDESLRCQPLPDESSPGELFAWEHVGNGEGLLDLRKQDHRK